MFGFLPLVGPELEAGADIGDTAVIEMSRPSGADRYRVVVWLLGLLLQVVANFP